MSLGTRPPPVQSDLAVDPTQENPSYLWLAYGHPAVAACGFVLAIAALRLGLGTRDFRVKGKAAPEGKVSGHRGLGLAGVVLAAVGLGTGLPSAVILRGWPALDTVHGWVGLVAAVLFVAAAGLGRQALQDRERAALHGLVALAAVAAALVACLAGLELLP